jgi:hypothetical protein
MQHGHVEVKWTGYHQRTMEPLKEILLCIGARWDVTLRAKLGMWHFMTGDRDTLQFPQHLLAIPRYTVPLQTQGGCVVTSIVNMFPDLHPSIILMARGMEMEGMANIRQVVHLLKPYVSALKLKGLNKLESLLNREGGVFLAEFDGHCVVWDCDHKRILESDPSVPHAVMGTRAGAEALGITHIDITYELFRNPGFYM